MKLKVLVASLLAMATLFSVAGLAGAANPEPTGWDDVNDQVIGSGSDTTYAFMQKFELLYNQAQGCETINTVGDPNLGKCITPVNASTATKGNWDHDYFVGKYPNGSSAGIKALQQGLVDYARSSRAPKSSGETDLNFWAFAKDALAMVTYGTRTPGNFTKAQIVGIYNCSITNWFQITGNSSDVGKVIQPVGMNPSSGTKATFDTYLGFDANSGPCVKKLQNGAFPTENDAKQITNDPTIDLNNAVWWSSYGEFRAYGYKRQSGKSWSVDGVSPSSATISNNTYSITRFIYHVTPKTSVTGTPGTENLTGADGGKAGAVREFTRFLCKTPANHDLNDFSGLSNYDELSGIYSSTGFIRLPSTERTNGLCKLVAG